MRVLAKIQVIVLILAGLCGSFAAQADGRYVFLGDSLVDNNNSYIATGILYSPTTTIPAYDKYYDGRFSNGLNWTDMLAPHQLEYMNYYFGGPQCTTVAGGWSGSSYCNPALNPGNGAGQSFNFAFGGSESGSANLPLAAPGLLTQISDLQSYITDHTIAPLTGSTFAILTGGNDYTAYISNPANSSYNIGNINGQVTTTLGNIKTALDEIATLYPKRAIVLNLFDLSKVPALITAFGPTSLQIQEAGSLALIHDQELPAILANVRATTGMNIVLVDLHAMYNDIFARQGLYGFSNITGSCYPDNNIANTMSCSPTQEAQTLFWDGQHPTTAAQAYIAQLVNSTLHAVDDAGGSYAAFADSGLVSQRAVQDAVRGEMSLLLNSEQSTSRSNSVQSKTGEGVAFITTNNEFGARAQGATLNKYTYDVLTTLGGFAFSPNSQSQMGFYGGFIQNAVTGNGDLPFTNDSLATGTFMTWHKDEMTYKWQATAMYQTVDGSRGTGFSVMPNASATAQGWSIGSEFETRWDHPIMMGAQPVNLGLFGRVSGAQSTLASFNEGGAAFLDLAMNGSSASALNGTFGATLSTRTSFNAVEFDPYVTFSSIESYTYGDRQVAGTLSSTQAITSGKGSKTGTTALLTGGVRVWGAKSLTADFSLSGGWGSGGETRYIMPALKIASKF